LVRRLLSANFQGSEALGKQLDNCAVKTLDDEGSFKFKINATCTKAIVKGRVPVEVEYSDQPSDESLTEERIMAPKVRLLLHVINGFLNELEIYKDDGTAIRKRPTPDLININSN
jgi:hypothetical protein